MRFDERAEAKVGLRVWARIRGFGYGSHARLVQGQVVSLEGLPNDARLLLHRTFVPVGGEKVKTCPRCRADIIDSRFKAHVADHERPLQPSADDLPPAA